jgi:ketosteroid isomerase-like protein
MKYSLLLLFIVALLFGCQTNGAHEMETWKEEVRITEKKFSDMAVEKGIVPAFLEFAADDAVINRNDSLIIGIDNIRARFEAMPATSGQLTWTPDFIDVAKSGDLAYTYGKYYFTTVDSVGNEITRTGVFHTVWKRQTDSSWKYVWD